MVSDLYPPAIGGLESHVEMLSRELVRRGHDVAVVTLGRPESPAFEVDCGVRVHRVNGWSNALVPLYKDRNRRFHPTVPDPGFMRGISRILEEEGSEIVHAHGWALYSAAALRRRHAFKLVVTLHDFSLMCATKVYSHRGSPCSGPGYLKCLSCSTGTYGVTKAAALTTGLRLSTRAHRHIDKALAVSHAVARAAEVELPKELIEVIPSFVADDAAEVALSAERPPFLPTEDGYMLFVGALGPHKGLDVLVRAYQMLDTRVPLVVVGTRRHDTPASFPKGVTVATDVPNREVMAAWARCSVGIVPSTCTESFGIVAVEAMACGRPVVASGIGGLREVVADGETGLLTRPGDPHSLRMAIQALLDAPSLRARMGEAARKRARAFTGSRVAERVEDVYRELLSDRADELAVPPAGML